LPIFTTLLLIAIPYILFVLFCIFFIDSHLGYKTRSLDTFEKDDYPRGNTSKIDPIWTRVLQKKIKMLRTTDAK
jgi:hypothetical protein